MNLADSDLIAAKNGDREAMGRLMTVHYEGLLRRICQQFHGDGIDHDELFQEACIAGFSAVKWFNPEKGCKFTTYLGNVVARRLKSLFSERKHAKLPQHHNDDQEAMYGNTPNRSDMSDLERHVANCTQLEQWIVHLKLRGLNPSTIGRRLGISAAMVDTIYGEILDYLRDRV